MKKRILFELLIAMIIMSSCNKHDVVVTPTEGPVTITFDWANLNPGESIPTGMKLYFYGNGTVITKESSGTGFTGTLPNGEYQMIAYNSDATGVSYANMDSYTNAQILVQPVTKATLLSQPKHVYGIALGSITVNGNTPVNQTAKPISFVKSVTLNFNVTGDPNAVESCAGSLTGVTQAVNIVTGEPIDSDGTVGFSPVLTNTGFASTFTIFGKVKTATNVLQANFNFVGGGQQALNVDISTAIAGVNQTWVPLEVAVDVKVTGTLNGGGFSASVTKWSASFGDIIVQ